MRHESPSGLWARSQQTLNEAGFDVDLTGSLRYGSEAFIREGLQMRAEELGDLEGELRDVERAKERLRRKARSVLREDDPDSAP